MITSSLLTHHATLFVHPQRKNISDTLWEELRQDSPAHTFFDNTILDIDTARSIASWANTPYNEKKIGLVSFHTITIPAQNALLKIVEEPPTHVQFIFITSNKENLLPTLLSRLNYVEQESKTISKNQSAEAFLKTPPQMRIKLPQITELLAKVDEEDRKDRESVRLFILELAKTLKEKNVSAHYVTETLEVASYAGLPSSSTKALVEYLSLLLPEVQ
ncbi:MAG: hypothetical protein KBC21_00540 [Candidatus Pacebacteria bacterium]|nr:hypothetical protein [Candidatus Paceibacterota bacterium]